MLPDIQRFWQIESFIKALIEIKLLWITFIPKLFNSNKSLAFFVLFKAKLICNYPEERLCTASSKVY